MGLADRLGGGHGIQVGRAALCVALAVLVWRISRPAGALVGRIAATAAVLLVGTTMWTERPLLVGLVLMAVLVWMAEADDGPAWPAVPIMWVWVNAHGSFPLGLVYLGVRLAGRRLDGGATQHLRSITLAAAAGTLAGAVNPLGLRLLVYPLELLSRHDLLERVSEWRSPDFSDPPNLVFLAALLVGLWLHRRSHRFEDGLVAVVFGAAGLLAVRNVPLALLALTPVLARSLAGVGTVRGDQRGPVTAAAAAALVMTALVLAAAALGRPAYDLRHYPVSHLDWMEERGMLEAHVATQDFVGNLIVARRGEGAGVFFDDRYDMYPRQVVVDAIALLDGRDGWRDRLDRYGIDVVLWERSEPLAGLVAADPGWRVVRGDEEWVVAVRAGGPFAPAAPA
ncbi:MAG: hypothetical protein ACRD03_11775 [Acidimicrobiales bacterium]